MNDDSVTPIIGDLQIRVHDLQLRMFILPHKTCWNRIIDYEIKVIDWAL